MVRDRQGVCYRNREGSKKFFDKTVSQAPPKAGGGSQTIPATRRCVLEWLAIEVLGWPITEQLTPTATAVAKLSNRVVLALDAEASTLIGSCRFHKTERNMRGVELCRRPAFNCSAADLF